jgi:3-deoxy-D-manno-octulosonic-acid transferase
VRGVLGNVKFDVLPDAAQLALGQAWRQSIGRPVVMLASSREGEEALWLECVQPYLAAASSKSDEKKDLPLYGKDFIAINNDDLAVKDPVETSDPSSPNLVKNTGIQWLIVPRHPQRVDAVERLLQQAGLTVARRSTWGDAGPAAKATVATTTLMDMDADIWLGDSLGEMAMYFGMADVVLLGGSFAPLGGQNLIEAAACGCPVVAGPHTFNFAQATEQACDAGAAWQVADMDAGVQAALAWIGSTPDAAAPELIQPLAASTPPMPYLQARSAALQFAHSHRGAAQAYAQAVVEVLGA